MTLNTLTRFHLFCSFGDITKHLLRWIHVLSGSVSKYQRSVWYIWIYLILSFVTATAVQHKCCACIMNSKKSVMYIWNSMHLSSQKCLTLQKMAKKLYFIWTCQPKVAIHSRQKTGFILTQGPDSYLWELCRENSKSNSFKEIKHCQTWCFWEDLV